jgi:hypothetical protein
VTNAWLLVSLVVVTMLALASGVDRFPTLEVLSASASGPVVPDELFREVRDKAHLRVVVKIAWDERSGETLVAAQDAVLATLAGTDYRLLQRYVNSAFLALEVGGEALAALARSPRVESVAADLTLRHMTP